MKNKDLINECEKILAKEGMSSRRLSTIPKSTHDKIANGDGEMVTQHLSAFKEFSQSPEFEDCVNKQYKNRTTVAAQNIKTIIFFVCEGLTIRDMSEPECAQYFKTYSKKAISRSSIHKYLVIAKRAFKSSSYFNKNWKVNLSMKKDKKTHKQSKHYDCKGCGTKYFPELEHDATIDYCGKCHRKVTNAG